MALGTVMTHRSEEWGGRESGREAEGRTGGREELREGGREGSGREPPGDRMWVVGFEPDKRNMFFPVSVYHSSFCNSFYLQS